jgi:hypothetical protein
MSDNVIESKHYNPIACTSEVETLPEVKPYMPQHITFAKGLVLTFPVNDHEFHMDKATKTESYQLEQEIRIPIIDTSGNAKFQGVGFVGDNGKTLRNWFRIRKEMPLKVLLWNMGNPIGFEMTIYTPWCPLDIQISEDINALEIKS